MRHKTYFGVPIPPFKEEKMGAGAITIRFVIAGRVPSKKNNQQAVTIRRIARQFLNETFKKKGVITIGDAQKAISMTKSKMRGNKPYQDFLLKMKPIIHAQSAVWMSRLQDKGLAFPLHKSSLSLQLYFKDRYITDTVNKQQTIQDLLIDCKIIANDDYKTLNPIHSASANYYEEIINDIAFISLSFRLDKNYSNAEIE
jgi:hypothetical protein